MTSETLLHPATLALIIPTLNEADNIRELVQRISATLGNIAWEILFVDDDSTDGTREVIHTLAEAGEPVRCLHRIGRKGLSSACIEGFLATDTPLVAVMDADLQHDESRLVLMYQTLTENDYDLVIGSRYISGGGVGEWHAGRQAISRFATRLTQSFTRIEVQDPMSGFFMFRRSALMPAIRQCSGMGFKILLDLLLSSPAPLKVTEIPFQFRTRVAGTSKLSPLIAWQLIMLMLDKWLGRFLPARFISFSIIGAIGVGVHLATLTLVYRGLGNGFLTGQVWATLTAMTSNYLLNNELTYSDRPLRGWNVLRGWVSFVVACSLGGVANVGIAELLFQQDVNWVLSAVVGVLVGAVWNYAVTSLYTWRIKDE